MKELNKSTSIVKRILIVLAVLVVVILILLKAQDLMKEKTDDTIKLIINNNNVTQRLKNEVKVEDETIYVSMDDIKNFFDKYIYIESETNEVVTTYNSKIASIGFDANKLTLNGSTKKINAHAIKENEIVDDLLIDSNCPECGYPISKDAAICPHCGILFDEKVLGIIKSNEKKLKNKNKKFSLKKFILDMFLILLFMILIFLVGNMLINKSAENYNNVNGTNVVSEK